MRAARFGRQADEVLWLARQVHLHHERNLNAFCSQLDDLEKSFPPKFLAREIVIGEEIKRNPVFLIVPAHHRRNALRTALTHFSPLHVYDGTEGAGEGTTARRVGGSKRWMGEVFHGLGASLRKRSHLDVYEILEILSETVDRSELPVEKIRQDGIPFSFHLSGNHTNRFAHQLLDIGFLFSQHVDRSAGVKSTDNDGNPLGAQDFCHVESARKLIRLHPD